MSPSSSDSLPVKKIPGSYGLPFFGPIRDRFDYFYRQGVDEFFKTRIEKYQSTIFRANMPPGPFISSHSKVVCVLDAVSFPILFDNSKVEKRDVLYGTYLPSLSYTGGYRVLAYLDPSEPKHGVLKRLCLSFLASRCDNVVPLFRSSMSDLFTNLEHELIETGGKAKFNAICDDMSYGFNFRLFTGKSPSESKPGEGSSNFTKWILFMIAPIAALGVSKLLVPLEDFLLHTFRLPPALVSSTYRTLYEAFRESATSFLDEAEAVGVSRDEACHNLVFLAGFNSYGGMKVLFPVLIKWVASAGHDLHRQLADEIRAVVGSSGGEITPSGLDKMALTKSVVYEALRIDPPVAFQYGIARDDIVVSSHAARFEIKKGEMIFGYQPMATRDRAVFERAEEFVGSRFVGAEGERLLRYVYSSNGRETEDPTAENKQCPGKDLVVLLSRVFLVELFLRYDTFDVDVETLLIGANVTFKSLTKVTG